MVRGGDLTPVYKYSNLHWIDDDVSNTMIAKPRHIFYREHILPLGCLDRAVQYSETQQVVPRKHVLQLLLFPSYFKPVPFGMV